MRAEQPDLIKQVQALLPKVLEELKTGDIFTEVGKLLGELNQLKECIICMQPISQLVDFEDMQCEHNEFHEKCLTKWITEKH